MLKLFEMWCDVVTSKPAYELVERFGHGNKGGTRSVVMRLRGTQRIEGWYRTGELVFKDYPMSLSSCNISRYHRVNCLRPLCWPPQ